MSGSHHPSLTLKTILLLMKGYQEAMHPVPIVVLFDLMFNHSLDHWLVCKSVSLLGSFVGLLIDSTNQIQ
jgi:hypothetical protein